MINDLESKNHLSLLKDCSTFVLEIINNNMVNIYAKVWMEKDDSEISDIDNIPSCHFTVIFGTTLHCEKYDNTA